MSTETLKGGEFPELYFFTPAQDDFLTHFIETRYAQFDFGKVEDPDGKFFKQESVALAVAFFQDLERWKKRALYGKHNTDFEELRHLSYVHLSHFAHNGIIEWEDRAGQCKVGSDDYVEANNEAYEWLKISRLAERIVSRSFLGRPKYIIPKWPRFDTQT